MKIWRTDREGKNTTILLEKMNWNAGWIGGKFSFWVSETYHTPDRGNIYTASIDKKDVMILAKRLVKIDPTILAELLTELINSHGAETERLENQAKDKVSKLQNELNAARALAAWAIKEKPRSTQTQEAIFNKLYKYHIWKDLKNRLPNKIRSLVSKAEKVSS